MTPFKFYSTIRECLQRGAHSPLLWTLVIEQILERLSVGYPSWYADDIDFIKASLYDCLQEGVNNTKSWCSATRWGWVWIQQRPTLYYFQLRDLKTLKTNWEKIDWRNEVKYLGIMLGKKVLWNEQVYKTVHKNKCPRQHKWCVEE